jgi:hypothetical protein
MIAERIASGLEQGLTVSQIAYGTPEFAGINGLFEDTWKSRPLTIARTELQKAQLQATANRFQTIGRGVVTGLLAHDGDHDAACAARDGRIYPVSQPPELLHPNCLPGEVVVWAPNQRAATKRWFDGEIVVLRTAAGDLLSVTPNHPILSPRGWLKAGDIRQGQSIIRCLDAKRMATVIDPDNQYRPAMIKQVADAFGPASKRSAATVPLTSVAFHGDASNGDICVIWADRSSQMRTGQHLSQPPVEWADSKTEAFSSRGSSHSSLHRIGTSAVSLVSGSGKEFALIRSRGAHSEEHRFARISDRPAASFPSTREISAGHVYLGGQSHRGFSGQVPGIQSQISRVIAHLSRMAHASHRPSQDVELLAQRFGVDSNDRSDLLETVASLIEPTRVVKVSRKKFAGHVYNLETAQGWFIAENIITHNCRLVVSPVIGGIP